MSSSKVLQIISLFTVSVSLCFSVTVSEADAAFYAYRDSNGILHITNNPTDSAYKWFKRESGDADISDSKNIDDIIYSISKNCLRNTPKTR